MKCQVGMCTASTLPTVLSVLLYYSGSWTCVLIVFLVSVLPDASAQTSKGDWDSDLPLHSVASPGWV